MSSRRARSKLQTSTNKDHLDIILTCRNFRHVRTTLPFQHAGSDGSDEQHGLHSTSPRNSDGKVQRSAYTPNTVQPQSQKIESIPLNPQVREETKKPARRMADGPGLAF